MVLGETILEKNVQVLVSTFNPIIIGTGNYWSPSVAKEVFSEMDSHFWKTHTSLLRSYTKKRVGDGLVNSTINQTKLVKVMANKCQKEIAEVAKEHVTNRDGSLRQENRP